MERAAASGDRFIPFEQTNEEPNLPSPFEPSLASKHLASRFGLSTETAITIARLVGLPQTEEG